MARQNGKSDYKSDYKCHRKKWQETEGWEFCFKNSANGLMWLLLLTVCPSSPVSLNPHLPLSLHTHTLLSDGIWCFFFLFVLPIFQLKKGWENGWAVWNLQVEIKKSEKTKGEMGKPKGLLCSQICPKEFNALNQQKESNSTDILFPL